VWRVVFLSVGVGVVGIAAGIPHAEGGVIVRFVSPAEACYSFAKRTAPINHCEIVSVLDKTIDDVLQFMSRDLRDQVRCNYDWGAFARSLHEERPLAGEYVLAWEDGADCPSCATIIDRLARQAVRNEFSVCGEFRYHGCGMAAIFDCEPDYERLVVRSDLGGLVGHLDGNPGALASDKSPYLDTSENGEYERETRDSIQTRDNAPSRTYPSTPHVGWFRCAAAVLALVTGISAILLASGSWQCRLRLLWAMAAYVLTPLLIIYAISAW
jgi:hypothetical protein